MALSTCKVLCDYVFNCKYLHYVKVQSLQSLLPLFATVKTCVKKLYHLSVVAAPLSNYPVLRESDFNCKDLRNEKVPPLRSFLLLLFPTGVKFQAGGGSVSNCKDLSNGKIASLQLFLRLFPPVFNCKDLDYAKVQSLQSNLSLFPTVKTWVMKTFHLYSRC